MDLMRKHSYPEYRRICTMANKKPMAKSALLSGRGEVVIDSLSLLPAKGKEIRLEANFMQKYCLHSIDAEILGQKISELKLLFYPSQLYLQIEVYGEEGRIGELEGTVISATVNIWEDQDEDDVTMGNDIAVEAWHKLCKI